MIIDDDKAVCATLEIVLGANGHTVSTAGNGASGIDMARAHRFDVAIVDLFMPGMDGLQVMKTLHAMAPDLPLIAASGFMMAGDRPCMPGFQDMASEAGAVTTLYKPFRPEDVFKAIDLALGALRPNDQARQAE
ncbi:MAG TPA: response regulator [Pseudorhodoplanes sp.]|nr:response regulator [Pseudorhodoplanes sp.]